MTLGCVTYSRVSTDAQERDGTSLDTQERACVEYAQANAWHILECVRDSASGFNLDRPGIERVRRSLHQGAVDVVVAYAVDRFSRNQNHTGVLFDEAEQAEAHLEFVTERFEDTAIGRFILAARAFIAEVEREKIAERTMRGKAERARSGRLPQGTGKGIYGYRYNREAGKREIDWPQATVVRKMFESYALTRSFSAVSTDLNEAGIPSFSGGRWYPLTVRTILKNETYTGRMVYRRTKRITNRSGVNGKRRSRVIVRPAEDWIEIKGVTPRIIDEGTWQRVQQIINDPERSHLLPAARLYVLRGRVKCGVCGSSMVGQTLTVKNRSYRYYRCRHAYDRNTGRNCSARYISADRLEAVIFREVKKVLTSPDIVMQEVERFSRHEVNKEEVARLQSELESVMKRQKRLVRLYTYGEVDEVAIQEEAADLSRKRTALEERLVSMRQRVTPTLNYFDPEKVTRLCAGVAEWLDRAGEAERALVLEALQVSVVATNVSTTMSGVLPVETPEFITNEGTSPCSCSGRLDGLETFLSPRRSNPWGQRCLVVRGMGGKPPTTLSFPSAVSPF